MGKQYEREISRAVEAVKDRELRAQMEKQARRRMVKVRAEASQEADATIVAHLAESQQDLGVAPALPQEVVRPEQLVPGVRVRVRGLGQPVVLRRRDESSAEVEAGPLRMKIPLDDSTAIISGEAAAQHAGRRGGSPCAPTGERRGRPSGSGSTGHAQAGEEPTRDELNVSGCTADTDKRS